MKDEMKLFLKNAWELGVIDNAAYEWMLSELEENTPKELFNFDLKAQMRKDMPELLMETEGLTEKEAIEETEKMIDESEKISTWAKDELEKMKCDFSNKFTFNINNIDKMINNPPFIEGTINAIWTPKQGPILSMNIIETIEDKYGPIPGETTKEKVEWLRKNITIVENK